MELVAQGLEAPLQMTNFGLKQMANMLAFMSGITREYNLIKSIQIKMIISNKLLFFLGHYYHSFLSLF